MVCDIAAIQSLYGADTTTRTGNTVYGFHCNLAPSDPELKIYDFNVNHTPIYTIWDAGGSDTLDCSGYSGNQIINLTPGAYSSVDGISQNVGIAFHCSIENAVGGSGNDTITGAGNGTLTGGAGADVFNITAGTEIIIDLGYGADSLIVYAGATAIATAAGNFTATGGTANSGIASINANGYAVSLALAGGTSGWSITNGSSAGVSLIGSAHNDVITGGSGNDTITGGGGNDTLTGGSGADRFLFNSIPHATANKDTVTDFVHGSDILQFSKVVFSAITSWTASAFWSGAGVVAGHDLTDRIVYNTSTGNLYYDADGSGAGAAMLVALIGINNHPGVTFNDIQLVA
jgi:Ca2+-binding RTX toxin-like protein